jgi:hypothetical protein
MPVGLVVKKASKIWSAFVASIPAPESSTVIVTSLVSSLDPTARARRFSAVVLIASAPFMIRLSSTSRNWTGLAEIRGKSAARFVLRAIFRDRNSRRDRLRTSLTSPLISTGTRLFAFFLNIALMLEITSFARCPSSRCAFERRACFTQIRLVPFEPTRTGMRVGNHSRQRLPDLMRDGGNHRTHGGETRAISVCPMISRSRATAIPRNSFTGKCPEWIGLRSNMRESLFSGLESAKCPARDQSKQQ